MSHHYSGPDFGFLVMNVHPSCTWNHAPTVEEPFATNALYEIQIDTDGDAIADVTYRAQFSALGGGGQTAKLLRIETGPSAATGDGQTIVEGAPVSVDRHARTTEAGGYRFFSDKDVCSIVIEVPNSALGAQEVGIWARTLYDAGGGRAQADWGARPGQGPFLVGDERNAYLAAEPGILERASSPGLHLDFAFATRMLSTRFG